jgi:methylthioribulose-1-phosphate dehydratase
MIDPRPRLIADAQHFYKQGWMVGTAGNLSARLPDGRFWITASGRSKGNLTCDDFICVDVNGNALPSSNGLRPSAETSIHQVLYTLFPEVFACYHVHSVEANLVSRLVQGNALALPALEMLKGLGVWEEHPQVVVPIFPNYLQVDQIADEIRQCFTDSPPQIPALLIRDHGVTVWAASQEKARNYIELVEYIYRYMIAAHQAGIFL